MFHFTCSVLSDEMGLHLLPLPPIDQRVHFFPKDGEKSMLILHAFVASMEAGLLDRAIHTASLAGFIGVRHVSMFVFQQNTNFTHPGLKVQRHNFLRQLLVCPSVLAMEAILRYFEASSTVGQDSLVGGPLRTPEKVFAWRCDELTEAVYGDETLMSKIVALAARLK